MNAPYAPPQTAGDIEPPSTSQASLEGLVLLLARVVWLVGFVAVLVLFAVSIPAYVAYLHTIRASGVDIYAGQLTPGGLRSLQALGLPLDGYAAYLVGLRILFVSIWLAVAIIIFWRKSNDRIALFASFTLMTFSIGFGYWTTEALPHWAMFLLGLNALSSTCISICLSLFPDGRFVPRWMGWPFILATIYHEYASNFLTGLLTAYPLLSLLDNLCFVGTLLGIAASQVYRYRRVSNAVQRQQTKWAVFGFAITVTGFLGSIALGMLFSASLLPGTLFFLTQDTILYFALLFIPLSIGLSVLRYRLWDIDIIINRTLVYGALTICIIGIYVLVVGYLGALFRTGNNLPVSLLATGLVAILFQPLREQLQRGANRLFYGQRDEPYAVITRLSQRLEATLTPDTVLSTIVETITQALKLPHAAILLQEGDTLTSAASYGDQPAELLTFPLVYQRETIGKLLLAPRSPGEAFTPADLLLLQELTHQIGLVAHTVRLTADLQRSNEHLQTARERLVTAREEERRRLRRDLHDGLGPTLAALALTASTLSELIPHRPDTAVALANSLQHDIRATVGDIRRLVYELRPPALDELGLIPAIRERAARINSTPQNETGQSTAVKLLVQIEAPESLPTLPAAVEVATYRIVQEALTNVTRHAQAQTCTVRFSLTDALEIEITDDGIGLPPDHDAGVGLLSMRERAAELGGECVIQTNNGSGTRVCARLPLAKE